MISNLHIKNIGIIDDININLNQGFNVLTGETGAGKTLIIDSLNIISGGRFSKDMIRKGQDYSFVEVCLYLPNNPNSIDGNIIVTREIYTNGRNLCKINGRLVTVSELKKFMLNIINIHGQNDNQDILEESSHIEYIDSFASKELYEIKKEYIQLYDKYNEINIELKNNYGDDKEKQRKLDLLRYQLNEIEEADLKIGEEEELTDIRNKMLNSEKIVQNLSEVDNQITNTAIDSVSIAVKALEKIENIDEKYKEKLTMLKSIYYDLQELSRDTYSLKEEIDFDEEERRDIDNRLDYIFSLKRKYGNNIEEILEYKKSIENEIYEIENLDEYLSKLKKEQEDLKHKMLELCIKMNKIRTENSTKISKAINKELQELEMKNATFGVKIDFDTEREFNINGLDKIEFVISTNIGEEKKTLTKIASGGEMSRIMLAIKSVLADVDKVPVLIFDEIDTGISGIAANSVAEKMKKISNKHQVLCVTHLASIAAKGDYNYFITKEVIDEHTKTKIKLLTEDETIKEIARIASGNITDVAIKHAKELRSR